MTVPSFSRPGLCQWAILLVLACWLATVPLAVMAALPMLLGDPPYLLVQLELLAPGDPMLPAWALDLVVIALYQTLRVF